MDSEPLLKRLSPFTKTFGFFLLLNLIASSINHIDDTDETYGYWEPLHYLLYGTGMQTWEYAPKYAIRTYAFILPAYICGWALKALSLHKEAIFQCIRALLATLTAYSEGRFLVSILHCFGQKMYMMTFILMLCSPGIFFSSTSFLPSAVTMNFVMLSCSSWLDSKYISTIIFGSIAVLWSGWPFVGVLFLPLGLAMVYTVTMGLNPHNGLRSGLLGLAQLVLSGLLVVLVVGVPPALIDMFMYQKMTSPTLNILFYNAIGGSGDELYGIEPASYYNRNLFLNTGLAWLMTLMAPMIYLTSLAMRRWLPMSPLTSTAAVKGKQNSEYAATLLAVPLILWLGILFTRPHKEERFMYPIYPLLAFAAANTVIAAADTASAIICSFKRERCIPTKQRISKSLLLLFSCLAFLLFSSRVVSNVRNYKGYMSLWSEASWGDLDLSDSSKSLVCTGSEWYQFPSHFLLPKGLQLGFIEDGFTGVLPQLFPPVNGTSAAPLQPFNDRNEEERSRYVPLESCDFVAIVIDRNGDGGLDTKYANVDQDHSEALGSKYGRSRRWHLVNSLTSKGQTSIGSSGLPTSLLTIPYSLPSLKISIESLAFSIISYSLVLSPEHSRPAILRAFYVPFYSHTATRRKECFILRRIKS